MLTMKAAKGNFFDRKLVMNAMDKADRRALMAAGAMTRTIARRSMRSSKTPSQPGQRPHAHNKLLKTLMLFDYQASLKSVIIGPKYTLRRSKQTSAMTVPEILEKGGMAKRRVFSQRDNRYLFTRTFRVPARPFMGPALEAARQNQKIARHWEHILDRGFSIGIGSR